MISWRDLSRLGCKRDGRIGAEGGSERDGRCSFAVRAKRGKERMEGKITANF